MLSTCAAAAAAVGVLLVGIAAAVPTPTETYKYSAVLDTEGKFKLFWKIDGTTVTFETVVETVGWVGFGLSPTGSMTGADVVIGWVANGIPVLQDRHATGPTMPLIDNQQDWSLLSGSEVAGFTVLKFKRQLATMDCKDDITITPDTLRLLWAYSPTDPSNENQISKHTVRGSKSLNLLDPQVNKSSSLPANLLRKDFLNPSVKVPNDSTTYWCQTFKMPALAKKHHMVKFDVVVQPDSVGIVHHVLAYACYTPMNESYEGLGAPCFVGILPSEIVNCRQTFMTWAIGGEPFYFPDNVGFSIGGPGDPVYFVVETHYDNPQRRNDIVDSSGFAVWYTSELRSQEAGILEAGHTVAPSMLIPPNLASFQISGFCNDECTKQALPPQGITVFGSFLHSHMIARKIRARHYRNGQDVGNLGRDEHYDVHYQQIVTLSTPSTVLPGDAILVECDYDSTNVKRMTYGGLATKDEMCLVFLYHYPKIDLGVCTSAIHPDKPVRLLRGDTAGVSFDYPRPNTTFWVDIVEQVNWTSPLVDGLQALQTSSQLLATCNARNSTPLSSSSLVSGKTAPFPAYVTPLKDNRDPCVTSSAPPAAAVSFVVLLLVGSIRL